MLRIAIAIFVLPFLAFTYIDPAAAGQLTVEERWEAKRKAKQQGMEEAAEAAVYEKMLNERKEHETTTEYWYYVNGKLDCKPAP